MGLVIDFLIEFFSVFDKKNGKKNLKKNILISLFLCASLVVLGFYVGKEQSRRTVENFCSSINVGDPVALLASRDLLRTESSGQDQNGTYYTSTFYTWHFACDVYARDAKIFAKSTRKILNP